MSRLHFLEGPMTWKETCTVSERRLFVEAWLSQKFEVSTLCERFGASRRSGHKWITRFKAEGMSGLEDRPRARLTQDHRRPVAGQERILALKHQYPQGGFATIQSALCRAEPH